MSIRLIGDVHGDTNAWLRASSKVQYSVQVGDFGFSKDWRRLLKFQKIPHPFHRDPHYHKILRGNHDHPIAATNPYNLGDYGLFQFPGEPEFFFIRGAYSVDRDFRVEGKSWWPEEELTYAECESCLDLYEKTKPSFVVSHDCPFEAAYRITYPNSPQYKIPNRTEQLLTQCLRTHTPKIWIFGHWHHHTTLEYLGCRFYCIGINCYRDIGFEDINYENDISEST